MGMGLSEVARLDRVEAELKALKERVEAHLDGVDNSQEFEKAEATPAGKPSKPRLQGQEA